MERNLEEITVEVIQKCNSNCIFCSSMSTQKCENEIPINKLKDISSFAKSKQTKTINISGGEPLLKTDLLEFVKYNHEIGLNTAIYTSGNVNVLDFILKIKQDENLSNSVKFIFNYQSSTPAIFAKLTGCDSSIIDLVNSNIKECIGAGFDVEAHIVPNAINLNSIYSTCEFLKEMGVKKVSLLRIVYQGRAENRKDILHIKDETILKNTIEQVQNNITNNDFNIRVGIPFSQYACEEKVCNAGHKKLIIRYDGTVFPCEAFKEAPNNERFILGDIYKDSMETIWNRYFTTNELLCLKEEAKTNCESCPAQMLYRV